MPGNLPLVAILFRLGSSSKGSLISLHRRVIRRCDSGGIHMDSIQGTGASKGLSCFPRKNAPMIESLRTVLTAEASLQRLCLDKTSKCCVVKVSRLFQGSDV
ncbi:Uncharacterized protein Adt_22681 [Abeliophyllum distichum]|uniref:Secreted protein n=1 Tax=Abeliophyllum distichum TaxID=126358 RepID=A0ABD1S9I8_9LAMI